jgi:hypothetical protein
MPLFDAPQAAPYPPALTQFVFSPDPFERSDVPRGLEPREVEAFVRQRVHAGVTVDVLDQVFLVVDLYDVQEVVPYLLELAEQKARSNVGGRKEEQPVLSFAARASVIRTAAVAGRPAERARAAALYRGLCAELPVEDLQLCARLVEAYETASPDLDARPLLKRLQAQAAPLARYETSLEPADAEHRRRYGEYDELVQRLQRAMKAAASKQAILALPARPTRLQVTARAYLDLPIDYPGHLVEWGARRLRRETWAPQPAEQIERTFRLELRREVVSVFRLLLREIEPAVAEDSVAAYQRVAALDAIVYFNGELTPDEHAYLVSAGAGYVLPLSHRQVWPKP